MSLTEGDISWNVFRFVGAVVVIAACSHPHEEPGENRDDDRVGDDERQAGDARLDRIRHERGEGVENDWDDEQEEGEPPPRRPRRRL